MGYWVYLQEASVEIPHERQPLALVALKRLVGNFSWVSNERYMAAETFAEVLVGLRWRVVQDQEGNIYTLEFNGQKRSDDYAPFETLAPFVNPGGRVRIMGEDDATWTWGFDGQRVHLLDGYATETSFYLVPLPGLPRFREPVVPGTTSEHEQVTLLCEQLIGQGEEANKGVWNNTWAKRFSARWRTIIRLLPIQLIDDYGQRGLDLTCWWWRTTLARTDDPGDIGLALTLDSMRWIFTNHSNTDLTAGEALAHDAVLLWVKRLLRALYDGHVARVHHLHLLAESIAALPRMWVQPGCEALLALLYDPWYEVRRCAAEALGRLGQHVELETLVPLLQSQTWEQREAAVQVLVWQGERVPLDWLLSALEDEHDTVRAAAVTALGMRGEAALLEHMLETSSECVQLAAYRALGELGAQAPVTKLLDCIKDSRYDSDRACAAMDALGKLGKDAGLASELLSELTQNYSNELKVAALHALDRLEAMVLPAHMINRFDADAGWPLLNSPGSPHARSLARHLLGKQQTTEEVLKLCDTWHQDMRKIALLLLGCRGSETLLAPLRTTLQGDFLYYQEQGVIFALEALSQGVTPIMLLEMLKDGNEKHKIFSWLNKEPNDIPQDNASKAMWALDAWREAIPVDMLLTHARDPHNKNRRGVLKLLAELNEGVPVTIFLEALDAKQFNVWEAVTALRKRWRDVPTASLLPLLESDNKQVRDMALEILAKQQYQPLIPQLLALLRNNVYNFAARDALMDLARFVSLDDLMQLFNEGDQTLKAHVIDIMGCMETRAPLSFLLALLERRAQYVQQVDEKTLLATDEAEHDDELVDSDLCRSVLKSLGKLGERVPVEPLLNALHDPNMQVVDAALEALRTRGGAIPITDVLSLLHHKSEYMRRDVVKTLGAIANPDAISALFEMLGDHVRDVRDEAVKALRGMAEQIRVEQLLTSLHSRSSSARAATLTLMAHIREGIPLEPVVSSLNDSSVEVRRAAVRALDRWPERIPVEPLLRALCDPSEFVRMGAVETLAKMGPRVPAEPLLACLGDTSEYVRRAVIISCLQWRPELLADVAAEANAVVRGEEAGPVLGSLAHSLKARVLGDIAQATPEAIALLNKTLYWPYWQVRMEGVRALGKLEGAIPLAVLQRLLDLRHDEESAAVREAAVEAVETLLAREPDIQVSVE